MISYATRTAAPVVGLHRQTPNTHLTGKVPACRLHPAFNRTFPSVVVAFKGKETSDEAVKRDEKSPWLNQENARKEMDKEQRKAGAQDADPDPEGGKGYEPAPVNGEGTGYNMKEVAEKTSTPSEGKKENAGEGAGVQDVE